MATEIHLIRHGAVQLSGERRYIGSTDLPLNDLGFEQARTLGVALKGIVFDAVFVSPMLRAQQTARLAAPDRENTTIANLREISFGDWEGLDFEGILARSPELVAKWAAGDPGFTFPNGDSVASFRERVCRCGDDLVGSDDLQTIAIVAHAGVIQTLICHFLSLPLEDHWRFMIDHATLTTVQLTGSFGSLARLNFRPSLNSQE